MAPQVQKRIIPICDTNRMSFFLSTDKNLLMTQERLKSLYILCLFLPQKNPLDPTQVMLGIQISEPLLIWYCSLIAFAETVFLPYLNRLRSLEKHVSLFNGSLVV